MVEVGYILVVVKVVEVGYILVVVKVVEVGSGSRSSIVIVIFTVLFANIISVFSYVTVCTVVCVLRINTVNREYETRGVSEFACPSRSRPRQDPPA